MLNFTLKKHWFQEIENGRKTIEYRKATEYWKARIKNIKAGDMVSLSLGYTGKRMYRRIEQIRLISCGMYTDLKDSGPVYAIYLESEKGR